MKMTYEEWIEIVKAHAGEDFERYDEDYSFREAFELGMKPSLAVEDARGWLDDPAW
jgi:hypothetical protein